MLPSTSILMALADEFCSITGRSRGSISHDLLDKGSRLDQIANGAQLSVATYSRALQWLSDNWPVEKAWPAQFERPSPSPRSLDDVPSLARRRARGNNDGGTDKFPV